MTDSPRAGTGRTLAGRYRLDRHLASGGMAEVWEATDEVLGRPVAVKVLHGHLADDPALRARFHHEAVAAARLVHPSIVAIYDTCDEPGAEAIVMELVRGRTLRQFLDERGRLEPVEVVHIGAEVASALSCAHRAGIVHRDVKPANILLSDDGRVLVTDFGIAKVLDEPDLTMTSQLLGTVKYLAPEQVESGPIDARTDVYALGAVLYESTCGEAPFRADTQAALALARLHRDPQLPHDVVAGVPPMLEAVVMRALARRPDDRFATADELRTALLGTRLDLHGDHTVVTGAHPLAGDTSRGGDVRPRAGRPPRHPGLGDSRLQRPATAPSAEAAHRRRRRRQPDRGGRPRARRPPGGHDRRRPPAVLPGRAVVGAVRRPPRSSSPSREPTRSTPKGTGTARTTSWPPPLSTGGPTPPGAPRPTRADPSATSSAASAWSSTWARRPRSRRSRSPPPPSAGR